MELSADGKTLVCVSDGDIDSNGTFIIPNWVACIGSRAFAGCRSLIQLSLHSVTSIGSWAFADCTNLRNIIVQGDVDKVKKLLPTELRQYVVSKENYEKAMVIINNEAVINNEAGKLSKFEMNFIGELLVSIGGLFPKHLDIIAAYYDGAEQRMMGLSFPANPDVWKIYEAQIKGISNKILSQMTSDSNAHLNSLERAPIEQSQSSKSQDNRFFAPQNTMCTGEWISEPIDPRPNCG